MSDLNEKYIKKANEIIDANEAFTNNRMDDLLWWLNSMPANLRFGDLPTNGEIGDRVDPMGKISGSKPIKDHASTVLTNKECEMIYLDTSLAQVFKGDFTHYYSSNGPLTVTDTDYRKLVEFIGTDARLLKGVGLRYFHISEKELDVCIRGRKPGWMRSFGCQYNNGLLYGAYVQRDINNRAQYNPRTRNYQTNWC